VRIGLIGSHGTGKSTLANALKTQLPQYELGKEFSREVSKKCGLNFETTNETQLAFYQSYLRMLDSHQPHNLITSRTLIDLLGYTLYFKNHDYGIGEELLSHMITTAELNLDWWDLYVYIPIEFDQATENEFRVGQVSHPEYRMEVDDNITHTLSQLNVSYLTVTGAVENRVSQILEAIDWKKS